MEEKQQVLARYSSQRSVSALANDVNTFRHCHKLTPFQHTIRGAPESRTASNKSMELTLNLCDIAESVSGVGIDSTFWGVGRKEKKPSYRDRKFSNHATTFAFAHGPRHTQKLSCCLKTIIPSLPGNAGLHCPRDPPAFIFSDRALPCNFSTTLMVTGHRRVHQSGNSYAAPRRWWVLADGRSGMWQVTHDRVARVTTCITPVVYYHVTKN